MLPVPVLSCVPSLSPNLRLHQSASALNLTMFASPQATSPLRPRRVHPSKQASYTPNMASPSRAPCPRVVRPLKFRRLLVPSGLATSTVLQPRKPSSLSSRPMEPSKVCGSCLRRSAALSTSSISTMPSAPKTMSSTAWAVISAFLMANRFALASERPIVPPRSLLRLLLLLPPVEDRRRSVGWKCNLRPLVRCGSDQSRLRLPRLRF